MACVFLVQSHLIYAAPIVIEGVVPNEASKQAILAKMQAVYGESQVLDKIQVRAVAARMVGMIQSLV